MHTIRETIVSELVETGKWSRDTAAAGERAGHRCEYCGLDFLASVAAYKLWQVDHIVPTCKGGSYGDFENLAIACKVCNIDLKGRFDPRPGAGERADRAELIQVVRQYIEEQRQLVEREVERMRGIIEPRTGNSTY